jgi:hypothetical protein
MGVTDNRATYEWRGFAVSGRICNHPSHDLYLAKKAEKNGRIAGKKIREILVDKAVEVTKEDE